MKAEDLTILIDSREIKPLHFRNIRSERCTLKTADYSCRVGDVDMRDIIAIERKSVADLVHSLGSERARFEREMERMKVIRWKHLVVEGELREIAAGSPHSSLTAKQIISPLLAWPHKYGINVWCAPDRAWAARMVEILLWHACRYYVVEAASASK